MPKVLARKPSSIATLTLTPPPRQDAVTTGGAPIAVTWPGINEPGGAVVTGGTLPYVYEYLYDPTSVFPVGTTVNTLAVESNDGQQVQANFDVVVTDDTPEPTPDPLVITCPGNQSATSFDGNPVAVTFAASAVGGVQPYSYVYTVLGSPVVSGATFAIGTHVVTATVTDSQSSPATDDCTFNIVVGAPSGGGTPPDPGANDLYTYLTGAAFDAYRIGARSMRSDADIIAFNGGAHEQVEYDATADMARFTLFPTTSGMESSKAPDLAQALSFPLVQTSGRFLWVYDVEFPEALRAFGSGGQRNVSTINYKAHKFNTKNAAVGGTGEAFHIEQRWSFSTSAAGLVATHDLRSYGAVVAGQDTAQPYSPTGAGALPVQSIVVPFDTRIRVWIEVRMEQPRSAFSAWEAEEGVTLEDTTYYMYSCWVGYLDNIYCAYDKVPISRVRNGAVRPVISDFRIEYDTSTEHAQADDGVFTFTGVDGSRVIGGTQIARDADGRIYRTVADVNATDGFVTFTGTSGTIPKNTNLLRVSDGLLYRTNANVAISGGTATVAARAMSGGADSNCAIGTDFVHEDTPVAGVDNAVEVSTAFTNGVSRFIGPAGGFASGEAQIAGYAQGSAPPQGGYASNAIVGTMCHHEGTPNTGVNNAVEITTAFTNGEDAYAAEVWWLEANQVLLKNYVLGANPLTDNPDIFVAPELA